MPTSNHIQFIELNRHLIREPILILASKIYEYDQENLQEHLKRWGFSRFTGMDLFEGPGVDVTGDITDRTLPFWEKNKNHFQTVFCMEILTNVTRPFAAAENVFNVLAPGGTLFLAECTVRKISKMPVDLWRFTYDGLKALFPEAEFDDAAGRMFYTRSKKKQDLMPVSGKLPEIISDARHTDENALGFFLRRIHRKISGGIFSLSRLLPETTVCAVGRKIKRN